MTVQLSRFESGGGVFHGVRISDSEKRWSIWFDKFGKYTDAEGRDRLDRMFSPNLKQEKILAHKLDRLLFIHGIKP